METYSDMFIRHQLEFDALPIMYAFNAEQFAEYGVKASDCVSTGFGGFCLKSDLEYIKAELARIDRESELALHSADEDWLYEMFLAELGNHEFCVTYDYEPALDACGLTQDDVLANPVMLAALKRAKHDYLASMERMGY